MKLIQLVTLLFVLIGGINWGLVGLIDVNLVTTIFGTSVLTTLIYLIVTFSTLYHVFPLVTKQIVTA